MNKLDLSIIIPVYNTEEYLDKCLNSIISQQIDNYEIIIVNDGSPDESERIIKSFKERYNNITYIKKENGGLSSARNEGLKVARGKYLGFVDSDDYIDKLMYSKMIKKAYEYNADIVICDMKYELDGKDVSNTEFKDFGVLSKEDALIKYLEQTYFRSHAQNKIYRRELFSGISFPEGKLFEDVATFYKLVDRSKRVAFINEKLYIYNQGNLSSITKRKFNIRNIDLIYNSADMVSFFENNKYSEKVINKSKELYFFQVKTILDMLYATKKALSKDEFVKIKKSILNSIQVDMYNKGLKNFYENNRCDLIKYNMYNLHFIFKFYQCKDIIKNIKRR